MCVDSLRHNRYTWSRAHVLKGIRCKQHGLNLNYLRIPGAARLGSLLQGRRCWMTCGDVYKSLYWMTMAQDGAARTMETGHAVVKGVVWGQWRGTSVDDDAIEIEGHGLKTMLENNVACEGEENLTRDNGGGRCYMRTMLVDNACGQCLRTMLEDNAWGQCLWTLLVDNACGQCLWTMLVDNARGRWCDDNANRAAVEDDEDNAWEQQWRLMLWGQCK